MSMESWACRPYEIFISSNMSSQTELLVPTLMYTEFIEHRLRVDDRERVENGPSCRLNFPVRCVCLEDKHELFTDLELLAEKDEQDHQGKTAAALCLTSVKNKDKMEFSRIVEAGKEKPVNPLYDKRWKQFGIKLPKLVQLQWKKGILMQGKAQMVVIAHVDPIELVTWLAALYCKMDCKARLGTVVLKKKRLCPTAVKNKDKMEFSRNVEAGKFVQKKTKDKDKMELSIIRVEACNIPALCRKMEVPYCIVNCKARLGAKKKMAAAALCLISVKNKNKEKIEFSRILETVNENFSDKYGDHRKKWGGGIMGSKSCAKMKAKEAAQ